MPLLRTDATQICTFNQDMSRPRWLGQIGHVQGLTYSWACPGGCDQLQCTLMVEATVRTEAMNPGRILQAFRGGDMIWEGILQEPQPNPNGWTISAIGAGNYGTNYVAYYTNTWPTGLPDQAVNLAIGRGLRWINPGIGSPSNIWLGQEVDPGAQTITDLLNLCCTYGSLTWYVTTSRYGNTLSVTALPTTPTNLLVSTSPVARTLGGDVSGVWQRYEVSADNSTTGAAAVYATVETLDSASAAQYGPLEQYIDLTQAGVMSSTAAKAVGQNLLNRYLRASFAGPFTVGPQQLCTLGGQPVDLGLGVSGGPMVCQLVLTDYAYGGEVSLLPPISFLVGAYTYDDDSQTAQITPFQYLDASFSGMLSAASTMITPPTTSS
jgi:hypothetical protein